MKNKSKLAEVPEKVDKGKRKATIPCVICHVYPLPSLERRLNLFLLPETWVSISKKPLNYNEHISKLFSSCVHKLVQINRSNIYRIKHLLHRKTLLLMINAFVFSKLFYFSTVWGNTSKSNIKKLLLVQNFRKFKVALNPMYRIFLNFAKSCILSCLSKFYNKKNFTVPFSKYKRLKLKSRVFLAGHSVAMVTYCVTQNNSHVFTSDWAVF